MTGVPRVFTCPAGAAFLDTLAQAIADGSCPGTGPGPDASAMPDMTIRLPTRRAIPALAQAFDNVSGGRGLLLPDISALGDEDPDGAGMAQPEVVSELERRIVLADIARAWASETSVWSQRSDELGPDPIPQNPADAVALAGELAQLIDAMESQNIDHEKMVAALPDDLSHLARNWEINRDFLKIAIQRWDHHLRRRNLVSAVGARDRLLAKEAARVAAPGFTQTYIVAGSTGSVPATARLLGAVARAQNGAVVLPGLDRALDSAGWEALEPGHPQFGMKQVIDSIGVTREQVVDLGSAPAAWMPARLSILSEAMRPAATTGRWVHRLQAMNKAEMARGLDAINLIEAANEHEEARVVALIMRATIEEPGKTAALVTPDRGLARRVCAELGRWDIRVDDSAGKPLAQTPPGVFFRLLAQAHNCRFSTLALLSLLKHPLTRLGRAASQVRQSARHLEIIALRGTRPGPGLAGIANAVRSEAQKSHRHPVRRRIQATDIGKAEELLDDLTRAFAPLAGYGDADTPVAVKDLLEAHIVVAQSLSATPDDVDGTTLWSDAAGAGLADFLAELLNASGQAMPIAPAAFPGWLEAMMARAVVRGHGALHPRLAIWGPLEARLMRADVLVLGGLVEGTWPGETTSDPWMGRHMRAAIGLEPPERRIGLQAHDFTQGLASPLVYLTRAEKSGGTPAVPSRWLWRLRALVDGLHLTDALRPARPWLEWARALDQPATTQPCPPPLPRPPVATRPTRLSVTQIETWLRDPYAIYARHILSLSPLEPLELAPDASDYGQYIHTALARLIEEHNTAPLAAGALQRLLEIGEICFAGLDDQPGLQAYWRARFVRVARWFVENDRRAPGTISQAEVAGALTFPAPVAGGQFTLTARADRIDVHTGGAADIIDYKTGRVPGAKALKNLQAPQLPLEAAILAGGGFAGPARRVESLSYIRLSGRDPAGEYSHLPGAPNELANRALQLLTGLIEAFADPDQPYIARVNPRYDKYSGDYDHLARVAEWSARLEPRNDR